MTQPARPRALVGISGWNYPPWRGTFYPPGLRQADELAYASRAFPTIEINGSFYSLKNPSNYRAWYAAVPPSFVFAVKGGRFITHMKRLRDVQSALANFFASGLFCLREKLGPILWQLPPSQRFDHALLRSFLELLPKTLLEAERLARQHDVRLRDRVQPEAELSDRPLQHTLEVRHESFTDARYIELLREHRVAACVADSAGLYPLIDVPTADFAYARLHGATQLYVSGYGRKQLEPWGVRVNSWLASGRSAFVYFDNDVKVRAPFDAENLSRLLVDKPLRRLPKILRSVTEEARTSWPAWRR